jgi:hypothetical protein
LGGDWRVGPTGGWRRLDHPRTPRARRAGEPVGPSGECAAGGGARGAGWLAGLRQEASPRERGLFLFSIPYFLGA